MAFIDGVIEESLWNLLMFGVHFYSIPISNWYFSLCLVSVNWTPSLEYNLLQIYIVLNTLDGQSTGL